MFLHLNEFAVVDRLQLNANAVIDVVGCHQVLLLLLLSSTLVYYSELQVQFSLSLSLSLSLFIVRRWSMIKHGARQDERRDYARLVIYVFYCETARHAGTADS